MSKFQELYENVVAGKTKVMNTIKEAAAHLKKKLENKTPGPGKIGVLLRSTPDYVIQLFADVTAKSGRTEVVLCVRKTSSDGRIINELPLTSYNVFNTDVVKHNERQLKTGDPEAKKLVKHEYGYTTGGIFGGDLDKAIDYVASRPETEIDELEA